MRDVVRTHPGRAGLGPLGGLVCAWLLLPSLIGLTLAPTGCQRDPKQEIGFGSVSNSVYHNAYFGLRVTFPPGWSIMDQAGLRRRAQAGVSVLAGRDKDLARQLKASELKSVPLFAAHKKPPGSPPPNPNISAVAERLEDPGTIRRGGDYLQQAKAVLQSGQLSVVFPKPIYSERFDGVEFDVLDVEILIEGQRVRQRQYCTIAKGYALGIVMAFTTDQDRALLDGIVKSITFDRPPGQP